MLDQNVGTWIHSRVGRCGDDCRGSRGSSSSGFGGRPFGCGHLANRCNGLSSDPVDASNSDLPSQSVQRISMD